MTAYLRALVRDAYANRPPVDGSACSLCNTTDTVNGTTVTDPTSGGGEDFYAQQYTTRSSGQDSATLVLFILFLTFSLCLITMRLSCYYNRNEPHPRPAGAHGDRHDRSIHQVRTQEAIEQMLLLKKVLSVEDSSVDLEKGKAAAEPRKTTKRMERKKSNLLLHSGGGDELDESRSCPICLGEYQNGESICWSHNKECFHRFHAACGVAWLAKHSECPVCRAEYLVKPSEDEEEELKKGADTTDILLSSVRTQNPIVIIEEEEDSLPEENSTDAGDSV